MAKVFEVDFRKGTYRDQVGNVVPSVTGTIPIRQTERGLAGWFDGIGLLDYGNIHNLISSFTLVASFTNKESTDSGIVGTYSAGNDGYLLFIDISPLIDSLS